MILTDSVRNLSLRRELTDKVDQPSPLFFHSLLHLHRIHPEDAYALGFAIEIQPEQDSGQQKADAEGGDGCTLLPCAVFRRCKRIIVTVVIHIRILILIAVAFPIQDFLQKGVQNPYQNTRFVLDYGHQSNLKTHLYYFLKLVLIQVRFQYNLQWNCA